MAFVRLLTPRADDSVVVSELMRQRIPASGPIRGTVDGTDIPVVLSSLSIGAPMHVVNALACGLTTYGIYSSLPVAKCISDAFLRKLNDRSPICFTSICSRG